MKLFAQIAIILLLLITPLQTPISHAYNDTQISGTSIESVNTKQLAEPYSKVETVTFIEPPIFFIKPGQPIIPLYSYTWTFPFGTNITSIRVYAKNLAIKQIPKITNQTPNPTTSAYENLSIHNPQREQQHDYKNIPRLDCYDIRLNAGIKNNERVIFVNIAIYPLILINKLNICVIPNKISVSFDFEKTYEHRPYEESYDMLLITIDSFKESLKPYIEHKKNTTSIIIKTLEDIPHLGRDIQEDLKLFIMKGIEEWGIRSVLFVGGYNEIPVRNVFVQEIRSILMDDSMFISDLYYADIYDANGDFCTWDSNNNNIFGEFTLNELRPTDTVDLYPDVYFGRLACRSTEEVNISINKIIAYETSTSLESEWFNNAIAIGADTFTQDMLGISEGEVITEAIASLLPGFKIIKLWGSNSALQHAQDISNAIENGAGFVFFEGHAGSNSFRTHPSQSPSEWIPLEWYRTYHINELSNKGKYPVVSINACNTCKFSVNHTSFGWSFVINPFGGSIATVGMTCLSWIYPGILCTYGLGGLIHQKFYNSYSSGAVTFGQMWADSITSYLNETPWYLSTYDHKTVKSWQPFGDPTLKLPEFSS